MAQTITPQCNEGYSANQQHSGSNSTFVVVDEQPRQRESFPYKLQIKWILGFSIFKCIVGALLFITGIVNIISVNYDTKIGFPIWCGVLIMINGIIGCVLKCSQTKCLIAAFLGMSITSLILDVSMLSFYSVVLEYFVNVKRFYCYYYYYYYGYRCNMLISSSARDLGIGIASFLIALIVLELACSIGSIVVSCKAYSKCCNTCRTSDCCTCLGCCECDCIPLTAQQGSQPASPTQSNHQSIQMSSVQPPSYKPSQIPVQSNPCSQSNPCPQRSRCSQSNPCSGLVSFIINIPSYVFGTANGTQLSAINVTVNPAVANQQTPIIEPNRDAEHVQGLASFVHDGMQQYPIVR